MASVPTKGSKGKGQRTSATNSSNRVPSPLDYSFSHLTKPQDCYEEEPRSRNAKSEKKEGEKSRSKCLRLNNNALTNIASLFEVAERLMENPKNLSWLDLSFNELSTIDAIITEFENVQILYLHGNVIANFNEVEKLAIIPNLRKLTLHGNPIEKMKGYRHQVLSLFPNLQEFDFSCVTKSDKMIAETVRQRNTKAKKTKGKE